MSRPVENGPKLEVSGLSVAYGDLVAVWDASLTLRPGSVTALVGRNGAGKTTLLSGICGLLPIRSGTVALDGEDIGSLPPWRRVARGLSAVQEGKRVFRDLSVRENLVLGLRGGGVRRAALNTELDALYERFPILGERRAQRAADLSGGQQQMLAIATALAARPAVLLVDEPSSGLAPVFVDLVFECLERLRDDGLAILLVEQLVEQVLGGIADEVIVLERGRVTLRDSAANLSVEDVAESIYSSG
ncbi:ABC transporter ATP-binding protein [Actinomadura welshii]|uniref:ABC transporter ATP-binding protein n=3 Tax=Actinomadura livida TaxID=79909 RepID=A0A7W7MYF9_9ACTN|nr:ABC transporter ATP-binding protein [Actinomadura catellatispora]MBB4774817.1 branched-chain amino acid transport system ATP-binding protein [Actinomadura catellatispora]